MIKRIEDHNRLNGYLFVAIEFGAIAAVVAPFGIYWLGRQNWPLGAVAVGIFVNCLVVLARAVRSLVRRERGVGLWKIYTDTATRQRVAEAYPNLSADTAMVVIASLLPFVLAAITALEALRASKR